MRRSWSPEAEAKLVALYASAPMPRLAFLLKRTPNAITQHARKLGLNKGRLWTKQQLRELRRRFPHEKTAIIAADLGRPATSVHQKAHQLGLRKTKKYLASPAACRLRRGDGVGTAYRYPKGHVPANKGLRRPGWNAGRMADTWFKPGHSRNKAPIGSTRINADGYLDRKILDTGYPPRDWRGVHILLWEEFLGPVPPKHCISFKNGNKTDIRIDNLECISRRERMRRNTIHRYPKEIVQLTMLRGAVVRQINRRIRSERDPNRDQEPSRGPAGAPVRHASRAEGQGKPDGDRARPRRGRSGGKGDRAGQARGGLRPRDRRDSREDANRAAGAAPARAAWSAPVKPRRSRPGRAR